MRLGHREADDWVIVDTRTELQIQQTMVKAMKSRTCFIIAHRLSIIREADLILVIDEGRIVESGTHEALFAQKGFYYDLCRSQTESIVI